ncbi:hypothetical protein SANTM175S_09900 [Streptomyces antimycoticus]
MLDVTNTQDVDLRPSAEAHADLLATVRAGDVEHAATTLREHLLGAGNGLAPRCAPARTRGGRPGVNRPSLEGHRKGHRRGIAAAAAKGAAARVRPAPRPASGPALVHARHQGLVAHPHMLPRRPLRAVPVLGLDQVEDAMVLTVDSSSRPGRDSEVRTSRA